MTDKELRLSEYVLIESLQRGYPHSFRNLAKRSKQEEREIAAKSSLRWKERIDGWVYVPSVHAAAQAWDRRQDMTREDWQDFHRRVSKHLNRMKHLKGGETLFYSKGLDQAYVTEIIPSDKEIRIITVLPRGKSFPKTGTGKLVVETVEARVEIEYIYIE